MRFRSSASSSSGAVTPWSMRTAGRPAARGRSAVRPSTNMVWFGRSRASLAEGGREGSLLSGHFTYKSKTGQTDMPPSHKLGDSSSLLSVKVRPRLRKGLNHCPRPRPRHCSSVTVTLSTRNRARAQQRKQLLSYHYYYYFRVQHTHRQHSAGVVRFCHPCHYSHVHQRVDHRNQLTRHGERGVASCWPTGRYYTATPLLQRTSGGGHASGAKLALQWRGEAVHTRRRCTRPEQG